MGDVVQGKRLVALPFERRNDAVSAAPESRIGLHAVGARQQLGEGVGGEQPSAFREAVFGFELQGMERRISGILVLAEERAAILRVRQQRLSHGGRASGHLPDPAVIRNRHSVQCGLSWLELIVKLLAHAEILRIERIQRGNPREHPGTFICHVGGADIKAVGELVLEGEVPLLRVWQAVGVERPVSEALAVAET